MRSQIIEAQKIAGGSGTEQDIAEAKVELEVRSPVRYSYVGSKESDSFLGIGGLAGGAEVVIATTLQSQLYNNELFQQTLSILNLRISHRSCQMLREFIFIPMTLPQRYGETIVLDKNHTLYAQMTSLKLSPYQADT